MHKLSTWGYFALSGFLLTLAWVGVGNLTPLIFVALIPLFFFNNQAIIRGKMGIVLFLQNYLAFFIWNFCTTFWIYFASPYGAVGAIVLNSLFTTLALTLGVWISKKYYKSLHYLPMAAAWILWECLHQYWDLSWTWLTLGNVFANTQLLIQWYEWTGVLGGSLWILGINFLGFQFLFRLKKRIFRRALLVFTLPTLISLGILSVRRKMPQEKGVNVLVVQPNIDPYSEKFGPSGQSLLRDAVKSVYNDFKTKSVDHILLPETAVSDVFGYSSQNGQLILQGLWEHQLEKSKNLQALRQLTVAYFPKARLLGGMDAQSLSSANWPATCQPLSLDAEQTENFCYQNHNAAFWMTQNKIESYNKSKLVVGVELFPFHTLLYPLFHSWMADLGGTSGTLGTAKELAVFEDPRLKINIAPIICYESVYGAFVAKAVKKGANLLYIITNDAWWGKTPGHVQHQAYAQLRAIETRKWMARSANTGISSFIDPLGKSYQKTPYNQKMGIYQTIYPNTIQTFYTQLGDYLAYLAFVLLLFYFFAIFFQARFAFLKKKA